MSTRWTKGPMLVVATALAEVPDGMVQRIDGLRCASGVLDLSDWQFWWAVKRMRWRGWVSVQIRPGHSIWASCQHLPFFSLTDAGRAALASAKGDQ